MIGNFRKNMLVHPKQDRGLSVREAARLQGFGDTYRFVGTIGARQQQVADAVPPMLAEAVARAILRNHASWIACQAPVQIRNGMSMPVSKLPTRRVGVQKRQGGTIDYREAV